VGAGGILRPREPTRNPVTAVAVQQSPSLRAPTNRHLPPSNPLSAPLGQVLALGNQTLVHRAGQHSDALVPDLIAEVLAGDADGTRAGRAQNIHIEVVPLLGRRSRASNGHHQSASTPVLVAVMGRGQVVPAVQAASASRHPIVSIPTVPPAPET
jgi:hypothetical protein